MSGLSTVGLADYFATWPSLAWSVCRFSDGDPPGFYARRWRDHGVPVYDTVEEAVRRHGANASVIFAPAKFTHLPHLRRRP